MNIDTLIETAEKCGERTTDCNKCRFNGCENCVNELNKELVYRLKTAMQDLSHVCSTCKYENVKSREMPCAICMDRNKWEWRGVEYDS